MTKQLFFSAVFCLSYLLSFSQNISNILLEKNSNKIAYLKAGDSLVIGNLDTDNEQFIDAGLKENGNQRLLKWSSDGRYLTYEKNGLIHFYDTQQQRADSIFYKNNQQFNFFRWYLISQAAIGETELYFSASIDGIANPFALFKANLKTKKVEKVFQTNRDIGNIALSNDESYLAFMDYDYVDRKAVSTLYIWDTQKNKVVSQSEWADDTFFTTFYWNKTGTQLIGNIARGNSILFDFNKKNKTLEKKSLSLSAIDKVLGFDENNKVVGIHYEKNNYYFFRYETEDNTTISEVKTEGLSGIIGYFNKEFYYLRESGLTPRTLIATSEEKHYTAKDFIKNNPIKDYGFKALKHNAADGRSLTSYVYFPKNYQPSQSHNLLVLTYGGYYNTYPNLTYFMHERLFQYLNKNFIIAFVNTRGIGSERQSEGYGKVQLEDTELLLKQLENDYTIDKKFVMGHSHGATMVYYFLTHSDVFDGGISINGASDWIEQAKLDAMSGLPWGMGGKPDEIPEIYSEASPLKQIGNLNTPLLIFAGQQDTQIPSKINSEVFYNTASKLNKTVELILFPDEGHLIKQANHKELFWNKIDTFLNELNTSNSPIKIENHEK